MSVFFLSLMLLLLVIIMAWVKKELYNDDLVDFINYFSTQKGSAEKCQNQTSFQTWKSFDSSQKDLLPKKKVISRSLSRVMTRPMKCFGHVLFIFSPHFINKAQFFKQLVTLFVIYTVYEAIPSVYFTQIDNLFAFRLLTNYPGPFIMLFIFIVWISIWRFLFIINAVYMRKTEMINHRWLIRCRKFIKHLPQSACFLYSFLVSDLLRRPRPKKSEHRFFNGTSFCFSLISFLFGSKNLFSRS